jgi:alpha-N-arabinofuranosidase
MASAYVRRLAGTGPLTFALRNASGAIVAQAAAAVESKSWKKISVSLNIPKDSILPLSKAAFGLFVRDDCRIELDEITLMPSDAVDGFDPDVLSLASTMGMTVLRLGGNYSSTYHWRDGIGEPDHRRNLQNIAWGRRSHGAYRSTTTLAPMSFSTFVAESMSFHSLTSTWGRGQLKKPLIG